MCEIDTDAQRVIDALSKVLTEAIEESERYEDGLPHLMICTDLNTGYMTFSGPFSDRQSAQQVAVREAHDLGTDGPFHFRIAPLYPPLQLPGSLDPGYSQPAPTEPRPHSRQLRAVEGCETLDVTGGAPSECEPGELES